MVVQQLFDFDQSKSCLIQFLKFDFAFAAFIVSSWLMPGVLKPFASEFVCFSFAS